MFNAYSTKCSIRNANTIYNYIIEQCANSFIALKHQLEWDCLTIALSFDGWTTKANIPIFAIISHWIKIDWVVQKAILKFTALKGVHSSENIAMVVYKIVQDLNIACKLIVATSDNASNNGTLILSLHQLLLKDYNNKINKEFPNLKPLMRFQGVKSYIRCLVHALNWVVCNILNELKSRTMKEAQDGEDDVDLASPIAKLQHIVVQIGRSP